MDMTTTDFARLFHDATEKYLKARSEYLNIPKRFRDTPVEVAAATAYLTVVRDYLRLEQQVHVVTQGIRTDQAQEDFLNARLAALCGQLDMLVKSQEEKPRPQADAEPEVFTATTKVPEPRAKLEERLAEAERLRDKYRAEARSRRKEVRRLNTLMREAGRYSKAHLLHKVAYLEREVNRLGGNERFKVGEYGHLGTDEPGCVGRTRPSGRPE